MVRTEQDIGFDTPFYQGNDGTLSFTVFNPDGTRKTLTNASIEWLLAETDDIDNPHVTKTVGSGITITDGPNGECDVTLDSSDTSDLRGNKHHRLTVTDDNGDTYVAAVGTFKIQK